MLYGAPAGFFLPLLRLDEFVTRKPVTCACPAEPNSAAKITEIP